MANKNNQNDIMEANAKIATIMEPTREFSTFDRSNSIKIDFDSGKLIPFYFDEILPGDTIKIDTAILSRQITPIVQPMDNAKMTTAYFAVPNRLLSNWKSIMGENSDEWAQESFDELQQIEFDIPTQYKSHDSGSYLGIPPNVDMSKTGLTINNLAFKAYTMIWNEYFRDQNFEKMADVNNQGKPDAKIIKISEYDKLIYDPIISSQMGFGLLPVNNFPDLFQTCLPVPQKGVPAILPFDFNINENGHELQFNLLDGKDNIMKDAPAIFNGFNSSDTARQSMSGPANFFWNGGDTGESFPAQTGWKYGYKSGLLLEGKPVNINDLRNSITLQHYSELDARGGTRYIEWLQAHFGVNISNKEIQRPEYLGGQNDYLSINQVLNTAQTDTNPLGSVGGQGETFSENAGSINYSADEHMVLIGVLCVRPIMTYSQGLPRFFTKKDKLDFYDPIFSNIGEQPIYKSEIFLSENLTTNSDIFGYNEAWSEYRYKLNEAKGDFNGNVKSNLDPYSYVAKFEKAPFLGKDFRNVDKNIIGSTLAFPNEIQYFADIYVKNYTTRPMPVYSTPGIDKI